MIIAWGAYIFQIQSLFNELVDFVTPDAAYMIRLLEFTNFRGEELSVVFIEYFVLISINYIVSLLIYKSTITNNRNVLGVIFLLNLLVLIIICIISSIFWVIYILLSLLSILIITASLYVSSIFLTNLIKFDEGDIIFSSEKFSTEEITQKKLDCKLEEINKSDNSKISSEILQIDDAYYFEIYADEKIILDNKGEFIVNEKN